MLRQKSLKGFNNNLKLYLFVKHQPYFPFTDFYPSHLDTCICRFPQTSSKHLAITEWFEAAKQNRIWCFSLFFQFTIDSELVFCFVSFFFVVASTSLYKALLESNIFDRGSQNGLNPINLQICLFFPNWWYIFGAFYEHQENFQMISIDLVTSSQHINYTHWHQHIA